MMMMMIIMIMLASIKGCYQIPDAVVVVINN